MQFGNGLKISLEVPPIRIYTSCMEIKDVKGNWYSVDKGDLIDNGCEEGICVGIYLDGNELEFGVSDGKEGWSVLVEEIVKVNGEKI